MKFIVFQTEVRRSTVKHQHVKRTVLPPETTEQNQTVQRKLQKVFELFSKVFEKKTCFAKHQLLILVHPKFFF